MARPSITDEQLIAYAAGDLTGEEAGRVGSLIAKNPGAARTVAMYRLAAARRGTDDSVAPPRETLERAKAIFDPAAQTASGRAEGVIATIARLVFDSRLQPAAVRVGHGDDQFQLSFSTDDGDINVQAQRLETKGPGTRWQLIGQYSADEATGDLSVALYRPGETEPVAVARADEHAVFAMEVDPGDYEMRLSHTGAEIVVPGVGIG